MRAKIERAILTAFYLIGVMSCFVTGFWHVVHHHHQMAMLWGFGGAIILAVAQGRRRGG
jgi:hypothetical protein